MAAMLLVVGACTIGSFVGGPGPVSAADLPAGIEGSTAVAPIPGPVVRTFDPPDVPWGPGHRGVDLAGEEGEAVRAAMAGTISYAGVIDGVGWVTVAHGERLDTTHGDVVARVVIGQAVARGEVIGHLVEGAVHLDWGARLDGAHIDPLLLLQRWEAHLIDPDRMPRGDRRTVP